MAIEVLPTRDTAVSKRLTAFMQMSQRRTRGAVLHRAIAPPLVAWLQRLPAGAVSWRASANSSNPPTTIASVEVPNPVPVRIRSTGCLVSIIASIVLTVLLNLALRACVH